MTALFCSIDDFWKEFEDEWNKHLVSFSKQKRGPTPILSPSDMMTLVILFHQSNFRTFKHFYAHACLHLNSYFPKMLSYCRFIHTMKNLFIPLFAYLLKNRGRVTGISFVDSTSIKVCHNKRIRRNAVFKNIAKIGKTTTGWFYGFKLHLIINEHGEILSFLLTPGNISDVAVVEKLSHGIFGKLLGDKGYISSDLAKKLLSKGIELLTTLRKNMKKKMLGIKDRILLRKRSIIETVNDQLKNISQIEHSRHRSPDNFLVNLLSGLAAYTHQSKKPSLNLPNNEFDLMAF